MGLARNYENWPLFYDLGIRYLSTPCRLIPDPYERKRPDKGQERQRPKRSRPK